MVEILRTQREVYARQLEEKKNEDLEVVKNARFELIKEKIAEEVEQEHNDAIAEIELKISHYDFVIAEEEAKLVAEENHEEETFVEEVQE